MVASSKVWSIDLNPTAIGRAAVLCHIRYGLTLSRGIWCKLLTQSKQTKHNRPEPHSPKLWECLFVLHRQSPHGHKHYIYFKTHLQCRCHAFSWALLPCKRRPCIALYVRFHDIIPHFYSNISPCTLCSGQYYSVSQRAHCTIGILLTTLVVLQMSPPPE